MSRKLILYDGKGVIVVASGAKMYNQPRAPIQANTSKYHVYRPPSRFSSIVFDVIKYFVTSTCGSTWWNAKQPPSNADHVTTQV